MEKLSEMLSKEMLEFIKKDLSSKKWQKRFPVNEDANLQLKNQYANEDTNLQLGNKYDSEKIYEELGSGHKWAFRFLNGAIVQYKRTPCFYSQHNT